MLRVPLTFNVNILNLKKKTCIKPQLTNCDEKIGF